MPENNKTQERNIIVPPETLYKAADLADAWGVHITTIYRLINEGKIPSVVVGSGSRRVRSSDLEAYLAAKAEEEEARLKSLRERKAPVEDKDEEAALKGEVEEQFNEETVFNEETGTVDIVRTETGERPC